MDVLQDHLARARASGGVFARSVAQPPWGLRLPGTIHSVTEDITAIAISPVWASFVFFVILVLVLLVRPQGLFGVKVRERI